MRKISLVSLSLSLSVAFAFWLSLSPAASAAADSAKVTELASKDLIAAPGKELTMITVEYMPGAVDPIHTHNAQAMLYVLEGEIEMQVKGGPLTKLKPGQTYYEGPDDVHVIGRNTSKTNPAKFVVFFVKDKGAPILTPVQGASSK